MKRLSLLASSMLFAATANAALPSGVTDAITGAGTDAGTAIAAIIVVGVGIWALMRVKKLFP